MRKAKIVLWLAVLAMAVAAGWQIASCEIGNLELREDLRDIAADMGTRIGLSAPPSDEDLRSIVIQKAETHDIPLQPNQVTVRVTGEGKSAVIYLAADYNVRVNLLVFSFQMHFTPSSAK